MENKLTSICGLSIIGLAIYSQPIIDDASIGCPLIYNERERPYVDWNKVKDNLDKAGKSCDEAMNKLKEGNGNVFRTADRIKQLGAKATKELPTDLLDV